MESIFKISFHLERMVLLYLEMQFPLSLLSLRFAARMPARWGLWEIVICLFLDFGLKKQTQSFIYIIFILHLSKIQSIVFPIEISFLYFFETKANIALPLLLPSQRMR